MRMKETKATPTGYRTTYVAEVGERHVQAWSQDLLIQFPNSRGLPVVDWITLKWSELDGYEVFYDGDQPELVQWLEGLLDNNAVHLLDEYANSLRP